MISFSWMVSHTRVGNLQLVILFMCSHQFSGHQMSPWLRQVGGFAWQEPAVGYRHDSA